MRYQVPQFIEVEDKIFGPLTVKQFIYLVGTVGLIYISFHLLPGFVSFFVIPAIGVIGAALAFYKINNKPFITVIEAAFYYYLNAKLYIWKHSQVPKKGIAESTKAIRNMITIPKLSDSKLRDLSWSLDINEKMHNTIFSKETGQLESQKVRNRLGA